VSAAIVLSTDQVPPRERTGYWGDLVWRSFGRLRSDTWGDERFAGRIQRIELGSVRLCRLEATRHRVMRTAGADGSTEPDWLKLVVQYRGRSLFEQNGRRAWLDPGHFAVYDTNTSYSVSNPETVDQHVLLLPREPILQGQRALESLLVRPLSATAGLGRLACEAIRIAQEESDRAAQPISAELGDTIMRLVRLAMLENAGERLPATTGQLLRERIRAHVDQCLGDPQLDPDAIARALNCSKRLLHKAFENEDCSLLQYIWARRLDAVRADLTDPAQAGRSLTAIAFDRGFSSAAHFSRSFRSRFGIRPSDWRSEALAASQRT